MSGLVVLVLGGGVLSPPASLLLFRRSFPVVCPVSRFVDICFLLFRLMG